MKLISKSLDDTKKLGEKIGFILKPGDIICLIGDLGTGKTTLTQAIAKGMGIKDQVSSATFTLIREYYSKVNLYHFDVYRLDQCQSDYLGFDEYFFSEDGACVIEWADRIEDLLPEDRLEIRIKRISENEREFDIEAKGERSEEILGVIFSCWF